MRSPLNKRHALVLLSFTVIGAAFLILLFAPKSTERTDVLSVETVSTEEPAAAEEVFIPDTATAVSETSEPVEAVPASSPPASQTIEVPETPEPEMAQVPWTPLTDSE